MGNEHSFKVAILTEEGIVINTIPEEFHDDVEEYLFGEEQLNLSQNNTQYQTYTELNIKFENDFL